MTARWGSSMSQNRSSGEWELVGLEHLRYRELVSCSNCTDYQAGHGVVILKN